MKEKLITLLILILCIPAVLPLLRGDFFHFSDEPHTANLYQMIRGFESGQLPPRWAPDMSYNYGYPLFNFYYPLPFYLGAIFFLLTYSLITSLKVVFLITVPLSALGMYYWLRQHIGKLGSLVGAIIYIYTPYRAVDLYVRGAIGEALAFVFFPLVALGVQKNLESKKRLWIGLLGLFTGGLILSHNLASIFFLPWVVAYAVVFALLKKKWDGLIRAFGGLGLGVATSSYWWLPSLVERNLLQSQTPFNYKDHFPFIKQLLLPSWGYGASNPGPYDDISFQIGIVNILLVFAAVVTFLFAKKKTEKVLLGFFLASIALIFFLMNIRSDFIWRTFALANYVQFPWRILMMTTFLTSSLVIFLKLKEKARQLILLSLLLLSMVLTVGYFRPSEFFSPDDDYFLKRFFANRTLDGVRSEFSPEYVNYSEDYLLLPLVVKERPNVLPTAKFTSDSVSINSINEYSPVHFRVSVSALKGGEVDFHSYYFPGWKAKVDGVPVSLRVNDPHGNITIAVPEGEHEVEMYWEETLLRKFGNAISVAGLLLIGLFLWKGKYDSNKA